MSPDHSYNPFNNPEFRKEMSDLLDEKVGPVKSTVIEHDRWINQQKGAGRVVHVLWTGLVSATTAIAVKYLGK